MPYTPDWYPLTAALFNVYLAVICLMFLLHWPRVYRNLPWIGLMIAAGAIFTDALRVLRRVMLPGGILPRFSGELDALSSLVPSIGFATAITIWLIAARKERRTPTIN